MRLVSFKHSGRTSYGVVVDDTIIDVAPMADDVGGSLREAIKAEAFGRISAWAAGQSPGIPISDVEFLPVIPDPAKILCVGINYKTHLIETGRDMPTHPMVFTRFADSQVGHRQPIVRPRASDSLDYEGELAVVISKPTRHVKAEDALRHVAGYACYNDGSVRDWQKHTIQFIPGKNFPRIGGFGPWLVTTDEIPDPGALDLTTRLNGEVM